MSRVAVVTGGASGIGLGAARQPAADGHHVAVTDRDGPGAERAAAKPRADGAAARGVEIDVADRASVEAGFAEVRADRTPENIGGWLWRVGRNLVTSRGRRMAVADRHRGELVRDIEFASPELVAIQGEAQSEVISALEVLDRTGLTAVTMAAHGMSADDGLD